MRLLGGQRFFTGDRAEHLTRTLSIALGTLIMFVPLSPKAMSFFPLAAAFIFSFGWHAYGKKILPSPRALIALLFCALFLYLLSFWAALPDLHLRQACMVIAYLFSILLIWPHVRLQEDKNASRILHIMQFALIVAALLQLGCAIGAHYGIWYLDSDHLNQAAIMLCAMSLFFFSQNFSRKRFRLAALMLALAAALAFASESLSCKLALLMALLIWAMACKNPGRVLWLALFAAGLIIVMTPFLIPFIIDALHAKNFIAADPATYISRLQIWDFEQRALLRGDIFGHGIHAIRATNLAKETGLPVFLAAATHNHNLPLTLWYDTGLAGIGAALAGLAVLSRNSIAWPGRDAHHAIIVLSFLFAVGLFEYSIWFEWLLGFYGVIVALLGLSLPAARASMSR